MTINFGSNSISKIYLGTTEISKIFLGGNQVFESTPANISIEYKIRQYNTNTGNYITLSDSTKDYPIGGTQTFSETSNEGTVLVDMSVDTTNPNTLHVHIDNAGDIIELDVAVGAESEKKLVADKFYPAFQTNNGIQFAYSLSDNTYVIDFRINFYIAS